MKSHLKDCHDKSDKNLTCSRVRALRIAKYRENEALCVVQDSSVEEVEWVDVDNIDFDGVENRSDVEIEDYGLPIV